MAHTDGLFDHWNTGNVVIMTMHHDWAATRPVLLARCVGCVNVSDGKSSKCWSHRQHIPVVYFDGSQCKYVCLYLNIWVFTSVYEPLCESMGIYVKKSRWGHWQHIRASHIIACMHYHLGFIFKNSSWTYCFQPDAKIHHCLARGQKFENRNGHL